MRKNRVVREYLYTQNQIRVPYELNASRIVFFERIDRIEVARARQKKTEFSPPASADRNRDICCAGLGHIEKGEENIISHVNELIVKYTSGEAKKSQTISIKPLPSCSEKIEKLLKLFPTMPRDDAAIAFVLMSIGLQTAPE